MNTEALESLREKPLEYREQEEKTESIDGITAGVVIIPPRHNEECAECDQYPADYIEYCQDRMKDYYSKTGEVPRYRKKEVTDNEATGD